VVVLGIDGFDPTLLQQYVRQGKMTNCARLMVTGDFSPLQTTMPPQSPVAWSSFITGMDPAGHGIHDFVHRDPATMTLHDSMSRASGSEKNVTVGSWVFPIAGGSVELLRKGKAFWQILGEHGYSATVYRMPVNFPPVPARGKALSGMGTPDLLGTMGTFSLYTDKLPPNHASFTGGRAYEVQIENNRVKAKLSGPPNPFRRVPNAESVRLRSAGKNVALTYDHPECMFDFVVYLDPESKAAKFEVGKTEFILKEKEWSPWVRVDFEGMPWLANISSTARFYLKQVAPTFQLYVSPLQINPESPVMPITEPANWSKHLCQCLGYFYTQSMPEDTKALTWGVLSDTEFLERADLIFKESVKAMDYLLGSEKQDLLFFYLGSVDQVCHMMWRHIDPAHPGHQPEAKLEGVIQELYEKVDAWIGQVSQRLSPQTAFVIMSDHGFAPFYWGVNLNTWLLRNGYIRLKGTPTAKAMATLNDIDWSRTQAYALGLNGLYVNLKGREKNGIVAPGADYESVLAKLEKDLINWEDARHGKKPVSALERRRAGAAGESPDLIVGYSWGYRTSWESPLGNFPPELVEDNKDAWSGDHCMDARLVPGILLTNQRISKRNPALKDLTVALLDEFGIAAPPEMTGVDCLKPKE
jgi:predicted AlkP superfamily phosphohydrolase/phosphomutase